MAKTTYKDLTFTHKYLDEITTFIEGLIVNDSAAVVLACQVFEEHKALVDRTPFETEAESKAWLYVRARHLSIDYLMHHRNDAQKAEAVHAAIHDCPCSPL